MKMSEVFCIEIEPDDLMMQWQGEEEREAVAHAINCHDELVEALEGIKEDLLRRASIDTQGIKIVECSHSAWDGVKAALAKARGEA